MGKTRAFYFFFFIPSQTTWPQSTDTGRTDWWIIKEKLLYVSKVFSQSYLFLSVLEVAFLYFFKLGDQFQFATLDDLGSLNNQYLVFREVKKKNLSQ